MGTKTAVASVLVLVLAIQFYRCVDLQWGPGEYILYLINVSIGDSIMGKDDVESVQAYRATVEASTIQAMGFMTSESALAVQTEKVSVPSPENPNLSVTIYNPSAKSREQLPVILYIHGGGWVLMSVESYDMVARDLAAQTPAIVVSVEYRLAPEHPFPAAPNDVLTVLKWLSEPPPKEPRFEFDTRMDRSRIVIVGDSAGGNLAAVAAQDAKREGINILGQALIYPVIAFEPQWPSYWEPVGRPLLTTEQMAKFWQLYVPDTRDNHNPRVAPLYAEDLSGLAPALVQTAQFDPLRSEGAAYADALRDAGVSVQYKNYNLAHGLFRMPWSSAGVAMLNDVTEFVRSVTVTV